jgi:hypothetical protein
MAVQTKGAEKLGVAGRLFGTGFFFIFFAVGSIFCMVVAQRWWSEARTYFWDRTTARIVESKVVEQPTGPVTAQLAFSYSHQGKTYTREWQPENKGTQFAYELTQRYTPGSTHVCYVNPKSPSEAALERGNLWFGLVLLFPLVFVAVGIVGMVAVWLRHTPRSEKPITQRASGKSSHVLLYAFFGLFAAVGGVTTYFFGIIPVTRVLAAQSWLEVPCEIVGSQVRSHRDSDGTTYRVEIVYRYVYRGKNYTSDRYSFVSGSSSGYRSKADIVAQHPPGRKTRCFVNPDAPHEAVLNRSFHWDMAVALIPLAFFVVGAGGIYGTARSRRKEFLRKDPASQLRPTGLSAPTETHALGTQLNSASSRRGKFIGLLLIALFWNGIVGVFVFNVVSDWARGRGSVFETLFMLPFLAIGVAIVVGAIHQFLALFNPLVHLTLEPSHPRLGDAVKLRWRIEGKRERMANVVVTLEAREEARYRRGTSTVTDRSVFLKQEVFRIDGPPAAEGVATFQIPANAMHSFSAENNKIVWTLEVRGSVPKWPDVHDQSEVKVAPRRTA